MPTNFRKFGRKDLAAAEELSRKVGWPHRFEDWQFAHRLGKGHVAEERGELVGTVLSWAHDRRTASLGMAIVAPGRQGRGIGRKLMQLALRDLGTRAVLLNATQAGMPLYERLGFRAIGLIEQYQGVVSRVRAVPLARGERLRPMGASDGRELVALATRATGIARARLITHLLKTGEAIVLARGDESLGFAFFRRFGRGYLIGPVVAPDAERARALISHWVAMHPGKLLRIDVPASTGLGEWVDGIGLKRVATAVSMVKGAPPPVDPDVRCFAIGSQALG